METINDIVREMRKDIAEGTVGIWSDFGGEIARSYADRIEAAWMREREAGAAAAQICGEIGEMIGREATCKKYSQIFGADTVRDIAEEMLNTSMQDITAKVIYGWATRLAACEQSVTICNQLGNTARNCDVGTVKEQAERFDCFCYNHRSREKGCGDCPLLDGGPCCELAWTQMPYEKGEQK